MEKSLTSGPSATDRLAAMARLLRPVLRITPVRYSLAVVAWLVTGILLFGIVVGVAKVVGFAFGLLPSRVGPLPILLVLPILAFLATIIFSEKRFFIIKRFLAMIVVGYLIATLVFVLVHASPWDPLKIALGQHASETQLVTKMHHLFGTDKPLFRQYTDYMGGLLHGDLGYSTGSQTLGQPVVDIIKAGVPQSLTLGGYALLLSLYIGLPIGLVSALKQNSFVDHGSQTVMIIFYAVPAFVIAPVAQLIFGVQLHWLPVTGWNDPDPVRRFEEYILPVSIFALGIAGYLSKSFRSFMLEVLRQDYIRTARAKGLKERTVIYLHAAKNTLLPLASIVGPLIAFLVIGAFIIELFFGIPGIGYDTVAAVVGNDGPTIEGTTLLLAVAVVFINMLTDIFYAMVDPRVKL